MRVKHAAVVAGLALGLMSTVAQAAYTLDIDQVGANVVAIGSGSIDLSTFHLVGSSIAGRADIDPSYPAFDIGDTSESLYSGTLLGPSSFGSGIGALGDVTSGSTVGFNSADIVVPEGYKSGTQLGVSSATFFNQTLVSIGATEGTYVYSFAGAGESIDNITINVGVSPVPLPASAPMFGAALIALGAIGYGLKRKGKAAA